MYIEQSRNHTIKSGSEEIIQNNNHHSKCSIQVDNIEKLRIEKKASTYSNLNELEKVYETNISSVQVNSQSLTTKSFEPKIN